MRINHNIAALNSYRQLAINNTNSGKSLEKLSSGLRINKAGDDAAGLAISEKMRAQIKGLEQASRNAQDGISLIQTAEGALNETHSILQRMRELSVQAANDTLTADDRTSITTEIGQLKSEIDRIATTTKFNGQDLLNGTYGLKAVTTATVFGAGQVVTVDVAGAKTSESYTISSTAAGTIKLSDAAGNSVVLTAVTANFTGTLDFGSLGVKIQVNNLSTTTVLNTLVVQAGATAGAKFKIGANGTGAGSEDLSISINNVDQTALSVNGLLVDSHDNALSAITSIDNAIKEVNGVRSQLGAYQNRLEHTINNLGASQENLTASESRIRDVDMAKEMMEFTKNNILTQAATAMLAQANQQPQGVLQLLK